MKKFTLLLTGIFILSFQTSFSQENGEISAGKQQKIERLEAQKEELREQEDEKLKKKIARIDKGVEKDELTPTEAEELKKEAIQTHEQNIADQVEMIDLNIALIARNKNDDAYEKVGNTLYCAVHDHWDDNEDGAFYVGLGSNFPLASDGLDPYKSAGLSFNFGVLVGEFKLSPKNERLRLKPGIDFHWLNLPLSGNQVLVDENNSTNVMELPENLEYSRFNLFYMNFPVHLEYRLKNDFNVGFGGFFGFKLMSNQDYEYDLNNKFLHISRHRSFNTNNFRYGADVYFGWRKLKLNLRYYINPVFKDSNANTSHLSVGLLFGY